jgi:hypothetical protein
VINGKKVFVYNPAVSPVFFGPSTCRPSGRIALVCSPTRGPLVEHDAGFDRTVLHDRQRPDQVPTAEHPWGSAIADAAPLKREAPLLSL